MKQSAIIKFFKDGTFTDKTELEAEARGVQRQTYVEYYSYEQAWNDKRFRKTLEIFVMLVEDLKNQQEKQKISNI